MVCTFAGKHATAVRCYGKTMRQDKLQLKCKEKITISKPSSTTTNNLMALFGNVEVVSLPFTLLELARDGERGNGSHPIFFSLTRSVGSSHPWFSRSVLLLGLVCRLSLARHRIEHTQSTYRCRTGAETDRTYEWSSSLAPMATTITTMREMELGVSVCFETIYLIQNLFLIRVLELAEYQRQRWQGSYRDL